VAWAWWTRVRLFLINQRAVGASGLRAGRGPVASKACAAGGRAGTSPGAQAGARTPCCRRPCQPACRRGSAKQRCPWGVPPLQTGSSLPPYRHHLPPLVCSATLLTRRREHPGPPQQDPQLSGSLAATRGSPGHRACVPAGVRGFPRLATTRSAPLLPLPLAPTLAGNIRPRRRRNPRELLQHQSPPALDSIPDS